jgi:signal transduction histidine kinase
MILLKKSNKTLLFAIFMAFLFSCGKKENGRVMFAVEKDDGYTPSGMWQKFQDVPLDLTGIFNPGVTSHLWWMKVSIQSTKNDPDKYFFKLNNPHINRMEVYVEGSETATWVLGDNFPFDQRPFLNRDLVIPLDLEAFESKNLLISIDKIGETLMVEPKLLTENEFFQISSTENLFMGLFIGWMAIIFFAACFFAINLKEMSAFFYSLFIFSNAFWLFSHWGLGFQYFWPDNLVWADIVRLFFNLITNVFFLLLIISFFPPQKKNSKMVYSIYFVISLNIFVIINLAIFPVSFFPLALRIFFLRLIFGFSGLMTFIVIFYLIQQKRAKIPFAEYYLSGISFLMVIYMLQQLHQSGISLSVPNSVFDFSSSIGMLVESIFITAAFAGRAATYKKEKEQLSLEILQKEKEVADRLIQVQEDERNRLARDLHDSIGGMLASIYLEADKIGKQSPHANDTGHLKLMVKQSMDEARSISHNLTPPHLEELGLEKALQNHVHLVAEQNQLKINYYYGIKEYLNKALQLKLYRICGELLYNVVKHAKASEVMVQLLSVNDTLEIIVEDDGNGMETKKKINGIGLKNMRERVNYLKGDLHIDSNENGTTVIIHIPLKSNKE